MSAYPFKLARLVDTGEDITKRWFVIYYVWSEVKEQLVRKRLEITGTTVAERRAKAKEKIKEINRLLKTGVVVDAPPEEETAPLTSDPLPRDIGAGIDKFLLVKKSTIGHNSHKTYKSSLKIFRTFLDSKNWLKLRLDKFTAAQAHAYMDYISVELKLSNKSHNKHLGVVETMYNFYLNRQQLRKNPFIGVKTLAERPGRHTAFTSDQINRIREICELTQDQQLWLFLNFIYFTLARPQSELRLLRVGDILEHTIRIDANNAKNNRTAHVLIPPPLEQLIEQHKLRDYPPGNYVFSAGGKPGLKPVYEKYFYNQHRKILTLLKLSDKPYDLYGWKHTGVIAMYRATKDVKLIQRQCRHGSLDQTDKYLRDLGLFLDNNQFGDLTGL